jgi:hypothetical protein
MGAKMPVEVGTRTNQQDYHGGKSVLVNEEEKKTESLRHRPKRHDFSTLGCSS